MLPAMSFWNKGFPFIRDTSQISYQFSAVANFVETTFGVFYLTVKGIWSCHRINGASEPTHWESYKENRRYHIYLVDWWYKSHWLINTVSWRMQKTFHGVNSSWPSATYMRRDFQCLFPQRPRYVALISVLISPVPHLWGVTNGSLLDSPPNNRRSPASLISPSAPYMWRVTDPYPYACCVENIKYYHQNIGCSSRLPSSINCSCWNKWENLHDLL